MGAFPKTGKNYNLSITKAELDKQVEILLLLRSPEGRNDNLLPGSFVGSRNGDTFLAKRNFPYPSKYYPDIILKTKETPTGSNIDITVQLSPSVRLLMIITYIATGLLLAIATLFFIADKFTKDNAEIKFGPVLGAFIIGMIWSFMSLEGKRTLKSFEEQLQLPRH